jgi:hypothetical protein
MWLEGFLQVQPPFSTFDTEAERVVPDVDGFGLSRYGSVPASMSSGWIRGAEHFRITLSVSSNFDRLPYPDPQRAGNQMPASATLAG